jgi:hypothetical protein
MSNASRVLVHAHNGRVDHLHGRVMSRSERVHDPAPDASLSPANEAIVNNEQSMGRSLGAWWNYAFERLDGFAAPDSRYGSWHGPHATDIPLVDIVDLVLAVRAQAYSVEAGNVRHEHEWRVWKEVKLPENKILIPGVVSHATNVVEHPRLVADRIMRFAQIVGRENVIASTDCGLGGRIHPQIAWAKLAALADGAKLATGDLWQ